MSDLAEEPPLYNSNIINTYIKMLKVRYTFVNVAELLSYADMEPYQVEDEGHWFTQKQVDRFYEALVRATGNDKIAREAGQYAASPDAIGGKMRFLMGFVGPSLVFEMLDKITGRFTRSTVYSSKKRSRNEIEITVTPQPGVKEKPYQCQNRIGYFEAIVKAFNYKLLQVEHSECMFEGGKVCRYHVSWRESPAIYFKKIRNLGLILSALYFSFARVFFPTTTFIYAAPAVLAILFVLTLFCEYLERKDTKSILENLRSSTDNLLEQISVNYDHALMVNEIGHIISKHVQTDSLLSGVIEILKKWLDYDRGAIFLANQDRTRLEFVTGYGYSEKLLPLVEKAYFNLDKPESRGAFVLCFREKRPFLVNDVSEISDSLSPRSLEFARLTGSKSFICCPILYEDMSLGILAVDNIQTKRPLLQSDINLLMGIAPEIGISIRNVSLMEARDRQFRSLLKVLAASIDARDFLTAGHSEKVTEYATAICREMGLSRDFTEVVRVASLLHDYGKIGIQDAVLKKAGPLTLEEREEIKTHAVKTEGILDRIEFEGNYRDVPRIAGAHHERIDGTGYPKGLKGMEIPLGSRIIAVADFFEAITSKRHYRDPMPREEALEVLLAAAGDHLDEEVVKAFMGYLRTKEAFRRSELYSPNRQ